MRNANRLAGAPGNPEAWVKWATASVLGMAAASITSGFLAEVYYLRHGSGLRPIIVGLILGVLAIFVRRHSLVALTILVFVFALNGIAGIVLATQHSGDAPTGGILISGVILIILLRGFIAIRQLKALPKQRPAADDVLAG